MVITLVDVVVFLPIAFLPGTVGRFLSEFALVVVVATLTSLAVSFTITPSLAGNWSLLFALEAAAAHRSLRARLRAAAPMVRAPRASVGARAPALGRRGLCGRRRACGALVPLGVVGFEFIPPVDRGEIFVQVTYPTGTPLATVNAAIAAIDKRFATLRRRRFAHGARRGHAVELRRFDRAGIGRADPRLPQANHTQSTDVLARDARPDRKRARTDGSRRRDPGDRDGRRQRAADRLPRNFDQRTIPKSTRIKSRDALRETPGTPTLTARPNSSRRRSTSSSIAIARARSTSTSAKPPRRFARHSAGRSRRSSTRATARSTCRCSIRGSSRRRCGRSQRIPLRSNRGSLTYIGDIAKFVAGSVGSR